MAKKDESLPGWAWALIALGGAGAAGGLGYLGYRLIKKDSASTSASLQGMGLTSSPFLSPTRPASYPGYPPGGVYNFTPTVPPPAQKPKSDPGKDLLALGLKLGGQYLGAASGNPGGKALFGGLGDIAGGWL